MVGINAINISIGVNDVAKVIPASRGPQSTNDKAATPSAGNAPKANTQPLEIENATAPREVVLKNNIVLRISYDKNSNRFIYSSVDKTTGDVVRQYPPEEALKLLARSREPTTGLLVDEKT